MIIKMPPVMPNLVERHMMNAEANKVYATIFQYICNIFKILGTLIFAYGVYTYFQRSFILPAIIEIIFYLLTMLTILSKKISISLRRFAFIILMYFSNIFILIIAGPSGAGIICVTSFLVLGGCILDGKQQNYLIGINLMVFIAISLMLQTDLFIKFGIYGYRHTWIIVFTSAQALGICIMLILRILLRMLFQQNETYKIILDSINEGVGLYKDDGSTLFVNRFLLDNVHNEFQTGKNIDDQISDEYNALALNRNNQFNLAVETGRKISFEDYWNEHWFSNRLYPIKSDGQVGLITIITEDITERKRNNDLETEAKILKEKEQQLRQDDRNKNEFINALSHELRNPLATIIAGLSLLDLLDDNPNTRHTKEAIKRQAGQLCNLVDDLLNIARITNNKIQLKMEHLILNELAEKIYNDHKILFDQKNIDLVLELGMKPIHIIGDPTRIVQITGNLLQNSFKFTESGGFTKLSVYEKDRCAIIEVTDNGAGIDSKFMPHLFEPFKQADNSSERVKNGLGLGLSLVKSITELHGGQVSACSEGPGKGSQFIISLPIDEESHP